MSLRLAATAALLLAASAAGALEIDARAVARFDVGYARCERLYPHMLGRRDEAYLSLWRQRADAAQRARLAEARRSAAYRKEHRRFTKESAASTAPAASSPIEHQCQALWAETQRMARAAKS